MKLVISASPHIDSGATTRKIMGDVLIALCPALIAAVIICLPSSHYRLDFMFFCKTACAIAALCSHIACSGVAGMTLEFCVLSVKLSAQYTNEKPFHDARR